MKPVLLAAALLFAVTAVHAQEAPTYRFTAGIIAGGVPEPLGTDPCGKSVPGGGVHVNVARRITRNLDLQASGSAIAKLDDRCKTSSIVHGPYVHAYQVYDDGKSDEPLVSTDLRARVHTNGPVSVELAGGAGWTFLHSVPYTVVASGIRFGRNLHFILGSELRSYRVPYDLRITILPEVGPGQLITAKGGHAWRYGYFVTLSSSLPLGARREP